MDLASPAALTASRWAARLYGAALMAAFAAYQLSGGRLLSGAAGEDSFAAFAAVLTAYAGLREYARWTRTGAVDASRASGARWVSAWWFFSLGSAALAGATSEPGVAPLFPRPEAAAACATYALLVYAGTRASKAVRLGLRGGEGWNGPTLHPAAAGFSYFLIAADLLEAFTGRRIVPAGLHTPCLLVVVVHALEMQLRAWTRPEADMAPGREAWKTVVPWAGAYLILALARPFTPVSTPDGIAFMVVRLGALFAAQWTLKGLWSRFSAAAGPQAPESEQAEAEREHDEILFWLCAAYTAMLTAGFALFALRRADPEFSKLYDRMYLLLLAAYEGEKTARLYGSPRAEYPRGAAGKDGRTLPAPAPGDYAAELALKRRRWGWYFAAAWAAEAAVLLPLEVAHWAVIPDRFLMVCLGALGLTGLGVGGRAFGRTGRSGRIGPARLPVKLSSAARGASAMGSPDGDAEDQSRRDAVVAYLNRRKLDPPQGQDPAASRAEIEQDAGLSKDQVRRDLEALLAAGRVLRIGGSKNAKYTTPS